MPTSNQGVRIGPISLFTLVAALGMAVLSVLTVSTAKAMSALSQRTATMAVEAYQAEECAEAFVASIDEVLVTARERGDDREAALRTLALSVEEQAAAAAARASEHRDGTPAVTAKASIDGNDIVATFDTISGRRLDVRISIKKSVTYSITTWKATSQAGSVAADEHLWAGTSS